MRYTNTNFHEKLLRNILRVVAGAFAIAVLGGFVQEFNGSHNTPHRFGTSPASQQGTSISSDYLKKHGLFLLNTLGSHDFALKNQIFTVRADGSEKRLVTDAGMAPSWTSDGRIIFVSNRSGSAQIWIMDRNGRNARQIGNLPPIIGPLLPQMGSNGLISFMGNGGVFVMHSNGSGLKLLVPRGALPALSRSGTWLAYVMETNNPHHREIWRINTDGTGQKQLTFATDDPAHPDANAPSISPDETHIAFFSGKEADQGQAGLYQSIFTWGHRDVAVIPANGGSRKTLTNCVPVTSQAQIDALPTGSCIAADNPTWSPDGHWVIYGWTDGKSNRSGMIDLYGENKQPLFDQPHGVEWLPVTYID